MTIRTRLRDRHPYPNPPHKGEGTLPHAYLPTQRRRQFAKIGACGNPLPPVGRVRVGVCAAPVYRHRHMR